jgi:hypothetical protein
MHNTMHIELVVFTCEKPFVNTSKLKAPPLKPCTDTGFCSASYVSHAYTANTATKMTTVIAAAVVAVPVVSLTI